MGYERNDSGYGRPRGDYGRGTYGRSDYGRGDYGRNDYGRGYGGDRDRGSAPSPYDYDDRGFFQRAGDEVRSWFGDEEAERRRRYDERYDDRYEGRGEQDRGIGYGAGGFGADSAPGYGYREQGRGADRSRDDVIGYGWNRDRDAQRDTRGERQGPTQGQGGHDHNYRSWRDRQMSSYDRDYDEYRRENQSRFENEFATYRTRREGQRGLLSQVQEHQEVIGSDGQHVGTVDHVKGDRIKLTKTDQAAGGHHHTIPSAWFDAIEDGKVKITKTADQAKAAWREEADKGGDRGGLFGQNRNDAGDRDNTDWSTDRNLNRSFSGTY